MQAYESFIDSISISKLEHNIRNLFLRVFPKRKFTVDELAPVVLCLCLLHEISYKLILFQEKQLNLKHCIN